MRLALALAVAAFTAAPLAAQTAGSDAVTPESAVQSEVTVPLPARTGVFYYRAGRAPEGAQPTLRVRRVGRAAPPASAEGPPTASASPSPAAPPVTRDRGVEPGGVSRLDLALLEQSLLDALYRRLTEIARSRADAPAPAPPPVIVVPGRPRPEVPDRPAETPRGALSPPPVVPGPATVEEVERAILDTGLFRTTTVNFEFAQAELLPASQATLDVVANVLRRFPELQIEVGGYTDDRGSDATNDRLSQRRAEAVSGYLASAGIEPARLSAVGYGERRPVAANGTETGWALNRRVEFVVLNPEATETIRRTERPADDLRQIIREELQRLRQGDDG